MSTDTEVPCYKKSALEFKSSSFSAPVLVIHTTELKQIKHQLKEKLAQAPEFFKNSPLVLDLKCCNENDKSLDLEALIKLLHAENLLPIGISDASEEQQSIAIKFHIPIHTVRGAHTDTNKLNSNNIPDNKTDKINTQAINTLENKLISQPVRSGQRIYAKGDLTILSHVSAGAEIMAEGNIHVYGALRGKALAGVQGDTQSRIFCSVLQAELVSIAGHYKTSEDLDKLDLHQATQIYLQDQALIINNL